MYLQIRVTKKERSGQRDLLSAGHSSAGHKTQGRARLKPGGSSMACSWVPGAKVVQPSAAALPGC